MPGIIYIFRFANGKSYIGQTSRPFGKRVKAHRFCANKDNPRLAVHKAWRKYGQPEMKILAIVTDEELSPTEVRAIRVFGSFGKNGYNLTSGGETSPMLIPEIAEKVKRLALTPERIARNIAIHKGSKRSLESRKRISESLKGKQLGVPKTLEHRMKISESNKGNKSFIGRRHTVETRLKMSESAKKRWAKRTIE